MVREATFAWDLTDGHFDSLERRDSVLDDDLLVLARPKRKRRRKSSEPAERPSAMTRWAPTLRRHLADAAWGSGVLDRQRRPKT